MFGSGPLRQFADYRKNIGLVVAGLDHHENRNGEDDAVENHVQREVVPRCGVHDRPHHPIHHQPDFQETKGSWVPNYPLPRLLQSPMEPILVCPRHSKWCPNPPTIAPKLPIIVPKLPTTAPLLVLFIPLPLPVTATMTGRNAIQTTEIRITTIRKPTKLRGKNQQRGARHPDHQTGQNASQKTVKNIITMQLQG